MSIDSQEETGMTPRKVNILPESLTKLSCRSPLLQKTSITPFNLQNNLNKIQNLQLQMQESFSSSHIAALKFSHKPGLLRV